VSLEAVVRAGGLLRPGCAVVVLLSGGPDSVCLLGLAARIAGDRYEPVLAEVDTLELARAAVPGAEGSGATVTTDPPTMQRALAALALAARRHGGVDAVGLRVEGPALTLAPITDAAKAIVLGEELKDLGAGVAVRAIRALGGSVAVSGDELRIELA
jgi:hypothetical protein